MTVSEPIKPAPSRDLLLFDRNAVLIATFLGSLISGALIGWWNYRAMGRPDLAKRVLSIGIVAQVLLVIFAILTMTPNSMLQLLLMLIQLAIAWFGFQTLQSAAITWHIERGAKLQPRWRAAWFAVVTCFVFVFAFVFIAAVLAAAGIITLPEPPPSSPPA